MVNKFAASHTHTKLLDVFVSQNLLLSKQCDNIESQEHKRAFLLLNSFRHSSLDTLTSLYKIFIRPILEYNITVWSPYLLRDINQIDRMQHFFTCSLPGL